jgi:hypothetical protein
LVAAFSPVSASSLFSSFLRFLLGFCSTCPDLGLGIVDLCRSS